MGNFLDEFQGLNDVRANIVNRIKAHNLPVIILGAGSLAKNVTDNLNEFGIEVHGYAVDAEYYKPNQTYLNKPIFNFNDLYSQSSRYIFIPAIGSTADEGKRALNFLHDKNVIHYEIFANILEPIDYDYIENNQDRFFETYNLLEDELSKQTMIAYLQSRLTGDISFALKVFRPHEYFNELTNDVVTRNRGGVR